MGGTGRGLPLVRAMVRLHVGTLTIDSIKGHGTTVTARFPEARTLQPATEAVEGASSPGPTLPRRPGGGQQEGQLDRGQVRDPRAVGQDLRDVAIGQAERQHREDLQPQGDGAEGRSEEHTSELQSLMRISYAVFCLKKKNKRTTRENKTTKK